MGRCFGLRGLCDRARNVLRDTMISLRILALVSNVLFCSYGYLDHLYPVFILHAALFPINLLRLLRLVISAAAEAGVKAGRIAPTSAKLYLTSNLNP